MDLELLVRITLVDPPAGVLFALQRGKGELEQGARSTGAELSFNVPLRVRTMPDGPRCFGPFAQGPPQARFVYISSGTLAGDFRSPWTRRVKVPLGGLTPELLALLAASPGAQLVARIAGTSSDGGPCCASVPLLAPGWQVVEGVAPTQG